MLWFMTFKCPERESQLCHRENNWIGNVFLLAAGPLVSVRVGWCSPFLSVLCSAVPLWLHEGFPNKEPKIKTHFAIQTLSYVDLVKQRSWRASVSIQTNRNIHTFKHLWLVLRAAGAQPLGLRIIFTREASRAEREFIIHLMPFSSGPIISLPPLSAVFIQFTSIHSQPTQKMLPSTYVLLFH